jgi:nicotinamidase-related amidase
MIMNGDEDAANIRGCARGGVGLLIIDMINAMTFPGAKALLPKAEAVASVALRLRADADRLGVPTIYVNDNYGQWHSERSRIIEACSREAGPGRELVERMAPRNQDYFVIKPQLSGFYATNLPVMLPRLGVNRLVMTGVAADICILFTAADAHMREYDIWVPQDGVASEDDGHKQWALEMLAKAMDVEIRPTDALTLADWTDRR